MHTLVIINCLHDVGSTALKILITHEYDLFYLFNLYLALHVRLIIIDSNSLRVKIHINGVVCMNNVLVYNV